METSRAVIPVLHDLPSHGLVDRWGRLHRSLRLSVTDRCNLRCLYCMPESASDFEEPAGVLTFDELERIVRVFARLGVRKVRITGGEPTLRRGLEQLVARLAAIALIDDLAMTTNGLRMVELAGPLRRAGLRRVNLSLDALSEEGFFRVARRRGIDRVLAGIDATLAAGFEEVRINAVAIRGGNEEELLPLAAWAREKGVRLRFIEYMPLGGDRSWDAGRVLTGEELRQRLAAEFGPLVPAPRVDPAQPAVDYEYLDGGGVVGFISSVSEPFCGSCDRLRVTAEGALRNCLFSHQEWDLRAVLRGGKAADDDALLIAQIEQCVGAKEAGHLISQDAFEQPARPMYRIGG